MPETSAFGLSDSSPCKGELHPWMLDSNLSAQPRTATPASIPLPLDMALPMPLYPLEKLHIPPNYTPYKFLMVDDNVINLRIFHRVVQRLFPNAHIDLVVKLERVRPETLATYHVVFLDIEMPQVSGTDIACAVRSLPMLKHVGLVAVTTRYSQADLITYDQCGFDFTIPKPVTRGYAKMLCDIERVLNYRELFRQQCEFSPASSGAPSPHSH